MATIKIENLKPTGAELFFDSESFMNELRNEELGHVLGGDFTFICITNGRKKEVAAKEFLVGAAKEFLALPE